MGQFIFGILLEWFYNMIRRMWNWFWQTVWRMLAFALTTVSTLLKTYTRTRAVEESSTTAHVPQGRE